MINEYLAIKKALVKACDDMIKLGVNPFHHIAVEPEDAKLLETLYDVNLTHAKALAEYYVMKVSK